MPFEEVRPVISPDGRRIAYRSEGRLWIRDLDSETPREIPVGRADGGYYSPEGQYLTWSPDSRELVFPAEGELRRVPVVEGGSAATICKLPVPPEPGLRAVSGAAWSKDSDTIVFSTYGKGIYEVSARGGSPKLLWEEEHADDLFLLDTPKGRAVVYAINDRGAAAGHVLMIRTPDGERRRISSLDTSWPELVHSPTGHILFRKSPSNSPSIWAIPFASETFAAGEPFLAIRSGQGVSLSKEGTLVYLDMGRNPQFLAWRDRSGNIVGRAGETHQTVVQISLSPDGTRAVVAAVDDGPPALWIYDVQRLSKTRFGRSQVTRSTTQSGAIHLQPGRMFSRHLPTKRIGTAGLRFRTDSMTDSMSS
jgi:Tol biopolymer transport system component